MSSQLQKLIRKAIVELGCGNSDQLLLALNLEKALYNEKEVYFNELLETENA